MEEVLLLAGELVKSGAAWVMIMFGVFVGLDVFSPAFEERDEN